MLTWATGLPTLSCKNQNQKRKGKEREERKGKKAFEC